MFPMVFAPSSKLIQYVSTVVAVATPTPSPPTRVALPRDPRALARPVTGASRWGPMSLPDKAGYHPYIDNAHVQPLLHLFLPVDARVL